MTIFQKPGIDVLSEEPVDIGHSSLRLKRYDSVYQYDKAGMVNI